MMKPLMIGALSLATLAAPMAASAQDWRRDHDRDGRYERWERQERRAYRRWARGQVIPYNYRRSWYVDDYRRYGYRTPPRGYAYYRTDTGDIVLAAIATGVILSLLD